MCELSTSYLIFVMPKLSGGRKIQCSKEEQSKLTAKSAIMVAVSERFSKMQDEEAIYALAARSTDRGGRR
jgi:hypothetical protein